MSKTFVAVLMGSDSDLPVLELTLDVLDRLRIRCEVRITFAHRTAGATHAYMSRLLPVLGRAPGLHERQPGHPAPGPLGARRAARPGPRARLRPDRTLWGCRASGATGAVLR